MEKIKAYTISEQIFSNTAQAQTLLKNSSFGEKSGEKVVYSPFEAFYLMKENKLELFNHRNKKLTKEETLKKFTKDKNFLTKYLVFKDLRKKGYIVKTALKFGAEFRVYDKGSKVKKSHSKWICFTTKENKSTTWQDFTAKNRVAHSTKKNLLIAIVDDENQISYFEVKWTRT